MNLDVLQKELLNKGIVARLQGAPRGFCDGLIGIDRNERIVCAQSHDEEGFHGTSFWICGNHDNWYIGFWSGEVFSISSCEFIVQMVVELMSGKVVPLGKVLCRPPAEIAQQYGLTEIVIQ